MGKREKHFVLIHGAYHGAWCWYKLVPLLKFEGHKVTVLDMAASGIHPKRHQELKSFSDYAEPLIKFMEGLPADEKVILVGHSMGGITISHAMEKFPNKIAVAVYLTAFMPGPHLSITTILEEYNVQLDSELDNYSEFGNGKDNPPTSYSVGPNFLSTMLYQLSPPEDVALATMLVRPIALYGEEMFVKEMALREEHYGLVRRAYIVSDKDKVIKEKLQRWMIEKHPPDEVMLIQDSDHMVMFSNPQELSSCLQRVSRQFH